MPGAFASKHNVSLKLKPKALNNSEGYCKEVPEEVEIISYLPYKILSLIPLALFP